MRSVTTLYLLIILLALNACDLNSKTTSKVNSTICEEYNIYYNPAVQYFLVSGKNTPSASFFIWNTNEGLYLNKTGGRFYDDGPYRTISEAIESKKPRFFVGIYTWSEHKKSGNTLIEKRDGVVLENLCEQ